MTKLQTTATFDADLPVQNTKKRSCLKCSTSFQSNWAGERICPRCKGSNAWRSGTSIDTSSSGGRRR